MEYLLGKLVCGLKKKRENKSLRLAKKSWTKSEMVFVQNGMTKNFGQNFIFFNRGILGRKL